jgi:hypothetical protein
VFNRRVCNELEELPLLVMQKPFQNRHRNGQNNRGKYHEGETTTIDQSPQKDFGIHYCRVCFEKNKPTRK